MTLTTFWANAQIAAPDLYCIKNDTLQWVVPQVNCGNVMAYEIYYATDKQGPYTLLTSITNLVQNTYLHTAPGKDYYYFMKTLADCPGLTALNSDTLDNIDPPKIPIESVNVVNGKCLISWQAPSTTKQLAYIIYRTTPNGTLPVDTVSNSYSYLDAGSNPELKSESYYILALDLCGNASIFDKPHYSIFAESSLDYCTRRLKVKWTQYQNWENGVREYQIWAGINGGTPSPVDTVGPAETEYTINNVNNGDHLCVFIRAVQDVTGITAVSNELCADMDVIQPVKWIQPVSASVLEDNSVELKWAWNADADIKEASVAAGSTSAGITTSGGYSFTAPATVFNSLNYSGKNPAVSPVFFKINTKDACDAVVQSQPVSTIFLQAKANEDKTNSLSWQFPEQSGINLKNYSIYKNISGTESVLDVVAPDIFSKSDQVDIDKPEQVEICYYIVADAEITLGDGTVLQEKIRSNEVCVRQYASLYFPNALAAEGLNNEFKPVSVFAQNAEYSLVIYDRWGQQVFETSDINQGWKGKKGSDPLPQGVYVYYAKLKQPDGRVEERKGHVLLIR